MRETQLTRMAISKAVNERTEGSNIIPRCQYAGSDDQDSYPVWAVESN